MIKDLDLNKNGWVVNGLVESLATGLSDLENILVFIKVMLYQFKMKLHIMKELPTP